MKFILSIFITALLAYLLGIYLPWWSIAIAAFVVSLLINQGAGLSYLSAFLGIFILWSVLALLINTANAGILANRVRQLFGIGQSYQLIMLTGFIGGVVAGFSALSANLLRRLF